VDVMSISATPDRTMVLLTPIASVVTMVTDAISSYVYSPPYGGCNEGGMSTVKLAQMCSSSRMIFP
jgi:hypothetical protein